MSTAEDNAVRKRLIALVFITFLFCAPAKAGHVLAGGGYCEPCDNVGCICEPGEEPRSQSSQPVSTDLGSETLFVLAALILVLRYKA